MRLNLIEYLVMTNPLRALIQRQVEARRMGWFVCEKKKPAR